jgi:hypothetical protein
MGWRTRPGSRRTSGAVAVARPLVKREAMGRADKDGLREGQGARAEAGGVSLRPRRRLSRIGSLRAPGAILGVRYGIRVSPSALGPHSFGFS